MSRTAIQTKFLRKASTNNLLVEMIQVSLKSIIKNSNSLTSKDIESQVRIRELLLDVKDYLTTLEVGQF